MISIVTPTHLITPYLRELYESIEAQTFKDWEWVLYLNGSLSDRNVSKDFGENVKVYREEKRPNFNVGRIKAEAFSKAKGDIVVQVDHDDLLTEDCLEKINKAFDKKTDCVISNYIKLPSESKYESYTPDDKPIRKWTLPIHAVAWKKKAYDKIGGFDKDLLLFEDLDILYRTYKMLKIKKIPDHIYKYRINGINSSLNMGYFRGNILNQIERKYE